MDYAPKLIEQGVRNYMNVVLHKCYDHRIHLYSIVLNVIVLVVFVGGLGMILWYCSTKKISPEEKRRKMIREQEHVLTKIREFQSQKHKQQEQLTELTRRILPTESNDNYKNMLNGAEQSHGDLIYSMAMHETIGTYGSGKTSLR